MTREESYEIILNYVENELIAGDFMNPDYTVRDPEYTQEIKALNMMYKELSRVRLEG